MEKLQVARGVAMPFFPMRPCTGPALRTKRDVLKLWGEMKDLGRWIVQPKLNEDRAVLAVVDGKVYIQNRYAEWFRHPVTNLSQWLRLPNRTVLDGGVYKKQFYAFEALVVFGKSLLLATTAEREVLAYQMSRLCGVLWMFDRPGKNWLMGRSEHLPDFEGVVLKNAAAPYVIAGSATQESSSWFRRRWQ